MNHCTAPHPGHAEFLQYRPDSAYCSGISHSQPSELPCPPAAPLQNRCSKCGSKHGGHNPQCAQTVVDNLARYFPGRRITLLVGVLADKDYPAMLAALDTQAAAYIAATPLSPRALPAAELGDYLKRFGKPVTVCADPAQAAELALAHAAPEDVICAVGSLYMAGAIRMDLRRDHNENSGH